MIDLTQILRDAVEAKATWSEQLAMEYARSLAADEGTSLDWDEGSGEDWISVFTATERTAIVSVSLPLAFVLDEPTLDDVSTTVTAVRVPAFDENCLSCLPETYSEAFRYATGDISFEAFSAWDLWYDTI